MTDLPASPKKARKTGRDREIRRIRIMSLVQAGFSYAAIGRDVNLTRERVREIVAKSLTDDARGPRVDPRLVQCARLEPALRLAAMKIADCDLRGVDRLIKVLDKLDKYTPFPLPMKGESDEEIHQRLMDRLDRAAARLLPPLPPEQKPAGDASGEHAEGADAAAP